MKISFFELKEDEPQKIKAAITNKELFLSEEKLSIQNIDSAKDADIISVFVNSMVTKEIIDALPNLKMITTRSTGFDHIDTAYAKEKGIVVSNVPAYGSVTVAEFAFALILELSRKVHISNRLMRNDPNFSFKKVRGFDLFGKTIGVVGTGKIGKNVIKIAKGFGMNVIAFDMFPDQNFAKEQNFSYESLNGLLEKSDIITIHTPYTKETHHLINKDNVKSIKKGAYFINTARGEIVENEALLFGLKENILAGVGLDVWEGERDGAGKDILEFENVVATAHIAFCTTEAENEILRVTMDNISGFLENNPKNTVK